MIHLVGQTLGRYQILSLLGEGGMGAVFKGRDETLKRDVAIKVMNPQLARQGNFKERFLQEARTVARLSHPIIVQVYDFGQDQNQLYIVMEFVPGDNLQNHLKGLRERGQWMELAEAVRLVRQVALALDYAHNQGVLHRDLKPENIMLRPDPKEEPPYRPVITDMGLAKLVGGDVETQVGTAMGTPAYMSPEQALGLTAEATSDVYSLGVILFELSTGKLPFEISDLIEAVKVHSKQEPPAPRSIKPELPEALEQVILKALQREPEKRYQDAGSFAAALEGVLPPVSPAVAPEAPGKRATQFQEGVGEGRGASVLQEFASPVAGARDQIQVLLEGGKTTNIPIKPGGIVTIGREADNDVVLIDPQSSRKHARVEFDGKVYKVIDLNSRNGTFLEDAKLLPGVPEVWPMDKALRIGSTYLRLVRPKEADKTAVISPAHLPKGEKPGEAGPSGRSGILVDKDQISVEPGKMTSVTLTLMNQGSVVDHFILSAQGIPASWLPQPPPVVQLMPGGQQAVSLAISPPRNPSSRAGVYPVTFRVVSRDAPDRFGEVRANLTVTPYQQFASELHPQRVRTGKVARMKVSNLGNAQETFNLLWMDRAVELDFQPPQASLRIPEGQEAYAEFRAVPRQRALFGGERTHAFTAEVAATAGEPQVHSGEVVSRALIPIWIIPILVALCICLLAAAGLGYARVMQAQATSQAATATALAMADSDGDGLTNAQEASLGTDPQKVDTDEDDLTDGEEINTTGTDPKNKDTDGDTLLDGAEVKQIGTSPNNQDTDGDGINDNSDLSPLVLPTATALPTETPRPTQPPYQACPDTYPSRLHIGDHATVSEDPPLANRLRNDAGTEGTEIIGYIQPGEEIEIQQGPRCVENWVWWKVKSVETGKTGWTSEGDGVNYWLVPKP